MATETNETSSQDEQDGKGTKQAQQQDSGHEADDTKGGSDQTAGSGQRAEDDQPFDDAEEMSQEELAQQSEEAERKQAEDSKRKAGTIILVASVILGAIGLLVLLASTSVKQGNPPVEHPLVEQMLAVLGIVNLGLAGAIFIRKNWPRAIILAVMPLTIALLLLNLSLVGPVQYLIYVLCIAEIYVMFRRPILDEFDAPKE